ncbi:MAG: class I tRNA ligase family protein, partial [Chloroflexi bacterium]|nr:class I tRNA ligase family protein [Chloroflexota bacterium]
QRVWTLGMETEEGKGLTHTPSASAGIADRHPKAFALSDQLSADLRRKTHQTIQRVTQDIENFKFNTMIAALMEYTNYLQKARDAGAASTPAWREAMEALCLMLAPSAPHITEEMWARKGKPYSIHQQSWPVWDAKIAAEDMFILVVQVNGKVRDRIELPAHASEADAKDAAMKSSGVQKYLAGKVVRQVIYVPGKLLNVVVGD